MTFPRCWLQMLSIWVVLALWAPGATVAADKTAHPPRLAHYPEPGQLETFIEEARQYLEEHRDSEAAPAVALDLLMAATLDTNKTLADEMVVFLTLEHTKSVQARYMVASIGEAERFCGLLKKQVAERADAFSTAFAAKHSAAVRLGVEQWAGKIAANSLFTLQMALLGAVAGDMELNTVCRAKLAGEQGKVKEAAEIVFGEEKSTEKLLRLQPLLDEPAGQLCCRYLYEQLSPEERAQPAVARVHVERLLHQDKCAEALPVMEKLLAQKSDPQVMFWCGWCQGRIGQREQALETLAELGAEYPKSPWARLGADWAACLRNREANRSQLAGALAKSCRALCERGLDRIQGTAAYRDSKNGVIKVYLALSRADRLVEIQARRDDKMLFGYRTTARDTRCFFLGEQVVHLYPQSSGYPEFRYEVQRNKDGSGSLLWNFELTDTPRPLVENGSLVGFNMAFLQIPQVVAVLLKKGLGDHLLLAEPQTGTKGTVFRLVYPEISRPELVSLEACISPQDEVCSLTLGASASLDLRYGREESFPLTPPAWPDVPVVRHDKADGAQWVTSLMKSAGALLQMYGPEANTLSQLRAVPPALPAAAPVQGGIK